MGKGAIQNLDSMIYSAVFDTVRESLLVLSGDLRVMSANRSFYETFRVSPEETEGELIYGLGNHQWNIPRLRTLLEEILPKSVEFVGFEVEHEFPEIGRKNMLLNGRRIFQTQTQTQTQTILLAIEDITEHRKNERIKLEAESLRRANVELEKFSLVAAHDLKEPLRTIGNYLQLLLRNWSEIPAEANQFVSTCVNASRRGLDLIDDLLEFARAGQQHVENETKVDLNSSLSEALNNLRYLIDDVGVNVTSENLPPLIGDSKQFTQLFQNLIGNAIKYRCKTGTPSIHVGRESREMDWVFSISDNGIGFEERFASQIFDPFKRLHVRSEYAGTGIGLSICRRIVARYGGEIWATSKIGKGSTFYFSIPRIPDGSVCARTAQILLVDDASDSAAYLRHIFHGTTFHLDYAKDAVEAAEKAKNIRYDLILMDIEMPVIDGFAARERLVKAGVHVPIVAYSGGENGDRFRKVGFHSYLSKSTRPDTLLSFVAGFAR